MKNQKSRKYKRYIRKQIKKILQTNSPEYLKVMQNKFFIPQGNKIRRYKKTSR